MLDLEAVTYRYAGARGPSLTAVTLTLGPGEVVGLVGPNEAGKSTICLVAAGLAPRGGGRIAGLGVHGRRPVPGRGAPRRAGWAGRHRFRGRQPERHLLDGLRGGRVRTDEPGLAANRGHGPDRAGARGGGHSASRPSRSGAPVRRPAPTGGPGRGPGHGAAAPHPRRADGHARSRRHPPRRARRSPPWPRGAPRSSSPSRRPTCWPRSAAARSSSIEAESSETAPRRWYLPIRSWPPSASTPRPPSGSSTGRSPPGSTPRAWRSPRDRAPRRGSGLRLSRGRPRPDGVSLRIGARRGRGPGRPEWIGEDHARPPSQRAPAADVWSGAH